MDLYHPYYQPDLQPESAPNYLQRQDQALNISVKKHMSTVKIILIVFLVVFIIISIGFAIAYALKPSNSSNSGVCEDGKFLCGDGKTCCTTSCHCINDVCDCADGCDGTFCVFNAESGCCSGERPTCSVTGPQCCDEEGNNCVDF